MNYQSLEKEAYLIGMRILVNSDLELRILGVLNNTHPTAILCDIYSPSNMHCEIKLQLY